MAFERREIGFLVREQNETFRKRYFSGFNGTLSERVWLPRTTFKSMLLLNDLLSENGNDDQMNEEISRKILEKRQVGSCCEKTILNDNVEKRKANEKANAGTVRRLIMWKRDRFLTIQFRRVQK